MVSNCTGSARCLAAGLVLAAANLYYSVLSTEHCIVCNGGCNARGDINTLTMGSALMPACMLTMILSRCDV